MNLYIGIKIEILYENDSCFLDTFQASCLMRKCQLLQKSIFGTKTIKLYIDHICDQVFTTFFNFCGFDKLFVRA